MVKGSVGVVGAGTMGVGIAYVFAAAGYRVVVVEPNEQRSRELTRVVAAQADRGRERGKLAEADARALPGRVQRVASIAELDQALDLVVESVPELVELKQTVLREVELRSPRLLASNTSSLSIDTLAERLERPELFLGMHFFNPVWSLALVELVPGEATSKATISLGLALVESIGKQGITVRNVPGFATSRLDLISALEAMRMLEDGVANAEDIDRAVTLAYRHPVGPLRLSDIVGLDVRLDIAESLSSVYGERFAPPSILRDKVAAGELGQKSGRGFYVWD
jgi:3-hydroxybutyryl-CoA dehydrogenase